MRRSANFVWKASSGKESLHLRTRRAIRRLDKAPHEHEQEFVIGGYISGAHGFDALLVRVYENKELILVAKVKDGFVPRIRDELFPALKPGI